jgi:hypothetical protein
METLKDLVAAGRERDGTALDVAGRPAPYSYDKFCTNAWKAGNLLGHYGVHSLGELAVVVGPKSGDGPVGTVDAAEPLLALLGGTLLGATVDVRPASPVETRTIVTPAGVTGYEIPPECTHLAYGGPPEEPSVIHFEREAWSENPIEPPEPVASDDGALRADGVTYTHESVLDGVTAVVEQFDLDSDDRVVLAADATEPGALVAGVLAPLSVGATVQIPATNASGTLATGDTTLVVTDSENSDERFVSAPTVTRSLRDTHRA